MNPSNTSAEGGGALGSSTLANGRFTIATDQPHVKVAWRISRRKEELK
jgi:hypothetical protein